jgi:hypothetical protein
MRFEYQGTSLGDDEDNVRQGLNQVTWNDNTDHKLCNCGFGERSTLNCFPEKTVYKHFYRNEFITTEFSTGPAALVYEITRKKILRNGNSLVAFFRILHNQSKQ